MALTYKEIKEMMETTLSESVVAYIKNKKEEFTIPLLEGALNEVYNGEHVNITEKLDHLARSAVVSSLIYKIDDEFVRTGLDLHLRNFKPEDINLFREEIDKKIGNEKRKEIIDTMYSKFLLEYVLPNIKDNDFIARRFKNGIQLVMSAMPILRDLV